MELYAETALSASPARASRPAIGPRPLAFSRSKAWTIVAMSVLLGLGILLRLYPSAGYQKLGTDEHGYMVFVKQIEIAGLWNYDAVLQVYLDRQYQIREAVVPATRIGFLAPAAFLGDLFHLQAFPALHLTAALSGVLLLFLVALFAYRLGGTVPMLGTTALVATAPLPIFLCQRAMIDGYFAFWTIAALWLAWENLQRPRHLRWLLAYGLCLTILVLTKETAAFVVGSLLGLFLLNYFLRLGTVTLPLLLTTVAGPLVAVTILSLLMGGVGEFVRFFSMFAEKSHANWYSIVAQDGPWYRYAVDFLLVSPAILALAGARIFQLRRSDRADVFMAVFALLALALLSAVPFGISLRYAAFCEIPFAWLAFAQLRRMSRRFVSIRPAVAAAGLLLVVSAIGLNQYARIFVTGRCYDPITSQLVVTLGMHKPAEEVRAELAARPQPLSVRPARFRPAGQ